MHRPLPVALCALTLASCAHGPRPAPQFSDPMAAKTLQRLTEDYWDFEMRRNPIWATYLGDRRFDDQLPDITPQGHAHELEQANFLYQSTAAIDPVRLAAEDHITRESMLSRLDGFLKSEVCQLPLWEVSALDGVQTTLGELPSLHGISTAAQAEALLTRYQKSGAYLDQHVSNLRTGMERGYVATKVAVRRVVEQLDVMLKDAPEASPFVTTVKLPVDLAAGRRAELQANLVLTVRENVLPGLERYRDFLKNEYLPHARDEVGVEAVPDGEQCYRAQILAHTGLALSPDEIHRIGLEQAEENLAAMKEIARRTVGADDVSALIAHLAKDPKQRVKTRPELMAFADGLISRAKAKLPEVVGRQPTQDVKVKAIEAFREESSATGYYYAANASESRPGYFYLNTYAPQTRLLYLLQSLTFHESIPGHHLQGALAQELEGLPRFRRELSVGAYTEGWAHYAELLADEQGLYVGDAGRFGMLSDQALRAVRLVVDTGMHHLGWTRDRALQYAVEHTAEPRAELEREIDRYITWPGQALSYKLGQLEILKLRAEAKQALGDRFDLRAFHDELLGHGALPLPVLREVMTGWVARKNAERSRGPAPASADE